MLSADWDNLIILDGCRYEVFEDHHTFSGDLSPIYSQGAHSNEFMQATFADRQLHDTIYITSNPWSEQLSDDTFFLTRTTYTESEQGGEARLPEDVAKLTLETFEEYPNKRYIIHFMQPNNPYVGPIAEELREKLLTRNGVLCTELGLTSANTTTTITDEVPHLRRALRKGYITRQQMLEVYTENLKEVTRHSKRVINELGGKTTLTSDHGDMFGERLPPLYLKDYSHWEGVHSDVLRRVPWFEMDSQNRRDIEGGEPIREERIGASGVEEHLKSMGYLAD
ncbi:hypothetical protein [Halorarum halobium]|uniref:hypothetical protein n=1 Tax=Halorarum halobium TaxID=3075121 RepID=UPI0028A7CFAD|nr:hypothetical protein [Halobaculum sp. XH14]